MGLTLPSSVPAALHIALAGSYWTLPGWGSQLQFAGGAGQPSVGRLYYHPIRIDSPGLYDRVGLNISSAAPSGSLMRVGVYSNAPNDLPGDLLFDWGTVLIDATGAATVTMAWNARPGNYWLGMVVDGTPTVTQNASASGGMPPQSSPHIATITGGGTTGLAVHYVDGQSSAVAGGLSAAAVAPTARQSAGYLKMRVTFS